MYVGFLNLSVLNVLLSIHLKYFKKQKQKTTSFDKEN